MFFSNIYTFNNDFVILRFNNKYFSFFTFIFT